MRETQPSLVSFGLDVALCLLRPFPKTLRTDPKAEFTHLSLRPHEPSMNPLMCVCVCACVRVRKFNLVTPRQCSSKRWIFSFFFLPQGGLSSSILKITLTGG